MRYKARRACWVLVLFWSAATLHADQIRLKNGHEYSGKFIRGDSAVIEFQVLGRVETFKVADVAQIVFKEPELLPPPAPRVTAPVPQAPPAQAPPPQVPERRTPGEPLPPSAPAPPPSPIPGGVSPTESASAVTLPAGTTLTIRTLGPIDTDRNRAGDSFSASLDDDVVLDGRLLLARGTELKGMIAYAEESGRLAGKSELMLELTDIILGGGNVPIRTSDYSESGESRGRRTAAVAGGGAVVGAIIGAIAGGGKGAAVGAATGAAVGTGAQVLTRGQTLRIPAETLLDFRLKDPVALPAP